ncbi:hypothetical protein Tco_0437804 [Tanacetum coccineum]
MNCRFIIIINDLKTQGVITTTPTSRNEVGESSTAAPKPTGDPTEAVEEVAPTTLEGVNARVTELAAVQEQDTQDIYVVIEDGKEHCKLLFDLVLNEPFQYGTVTEPDTLTTLAIIRVRRYDELTNEEKIHKICDIKETNIVLQGLPQDIYNLINHHEEAKDIWDRVKLLIKGLVVPSFLPSDDLIASVNKEMAFISTTFTSRYPPTNNQLRTSSNLWNLETIQDGRVTVKTCTKPKRPKNSAWFKEKAMLAEALESGVEILTPAGFHSDDLDAFDFDCDEAPSASAILMAKLSSYDSAVLFEVPNHDTYPHNPITGHSVQEMQYSEQLVFNNDTDIDISNDSNMISYEQYLKETKIVIVQDTSSSA